MSVRYLVSMFVGVAATLLLSQAQAQERSLQCDKAYSSNDHPQPGFRPPVVLPIALTILLNVDVDKKKYSAEPNLIGGGDIKAVSENELILENVIFKVGEFDILRYARLDRRTLQLNIGLYRAQDKTTYSLLMYTCKLGADLPKKQL